MVNLRSRERSTGGSSLRRPACRGGPGCGLGAWMWGASTISTEWAGGGGGLLLQPGRGMAACLLSRGDLAIVEP